MNRIGAVLVSVAAAVALATPAASAATRGVDSGNFYFQDAATGSRSEIRVQLGDQLVVTTVEGRRHTVDVDELGISSGELSEGQTYTTPPLETAGSFRLYCRTHTNRGHVTTLVVTDPAPDPEPEPAPEPDPEPEPTGEPDTDPGSPSTTSPTAPDTAVSPSASSSPGDASSASASDRATDASPSPGDSASATDAAGSLAGPTAEPSPTQGDTATAGVTGQDMPWTRALVIAAVLGLPMAAAAAWARRRSP